MRLRLAGNWRRSGAGFWRGLYGTLLRCLIALHLPGIRFQHDLRARAGDISRGTGNPNGLSRGVLQPPRAAASFRGPARRRGFERLGAGAAVGRHRQRRGHSALPGEYGHFCDQGRLR